MEEMQERQVWFLGREGPLEEETTKYYSILALFLHEQRSLVGYSPWGCKESHMTDMQAQPGTYDKERIDSWINDIDKLHNHVQKDESLSLSYTIHRSQIKMD